MSYREKSAWINFVLLSTAFCLYFGKVLLEMGGSFQPIRSGNLFVFLVVAVVMIEVVSHFLLAIRAPRDAQTPKDERERLIETRALRPAYYVAVVGTFLSIGTIHFHTTKLDVAHAVLYSIWTAELVRYGMQIYFYRRGA